MTILRDKIVLSLIFSMLFALEGLSGENPFSDMVIQDNVTSESEKVVSLERGFIYYVLYFEQFHERSQGLFTIHSENLNLVRSTRQNPSYKGNLDAARVLLMSDSEIESIISEYESVAGRVFQVQEYMSESSKHASTIQYIRNQAEGVLAYPLYPKITTSVQFDQVNRLASVLLKKQFIYDPNSQVIFPTGVRKWNRCWLSLVSKTKLRKSL